MAIAPQLDVLGYLRDASRTGAAIGAQMFNNTLRMQQLQSEQALQRLREQQMAQELAFKLEAHDRMVEEQADFAKASARVEADLAMQQALPTQMATGVSLRSQGGGAIDPYQSGDGAPVATPPSPEMVTQSLVKNFLPPMLKHRPQEVDNFLANAALMEQRRRVSQFEPRLLTRKDPVTGRDITFAEERPGSFQRVPESQTQRMFDRFKLDEQKRMLASVEKSRPDLYSKLPKDERGMRYVPDDIIDEVAKQAGITTATRSALEQVELGADNVFALGRELLPLINERTTGAKAEAKRLLQRTGITAIFPALDDPEISEADAVGRTFAAGVVRAMRSDSNIGIREQETLARAAETINWTTAKSGKTKLAAVVRQAADHSRRAAQRKGTPVNPLFLTREEIAARVEAGELTPEEGAQLYRNTAGAFLKEIDAQIK